MRERTREFASLSPRYPLPLPISLLSRSLTRACTHVASESLREHPCTSLGTEPSYLVVFADFLLVEHVPLTKPGSVERGKPRHGILSDRLVAR